MSQLPSINPGLILNRLIVDKATVDCDGKSVAVTGTISPAEAQFLADLIIRNEFCTCLETGVAYGGSTVAICAALSQLEQRGKKVKHYGVDPCQFDTYGGPAIAALRECDLDHIFELCEGPSHLMLPELIKRGVTIDFAFIDGMHTFDYTVLDLFYSDKLLRKGGIICMHDMELPSKRKAFSYLMRHRKYVRLSGLEEQFRSRMGHAMRYAVQAKPRATWNVLTSMGSIGVAQKMESYEPNWDFYARF